MAGFRKGRGESIEFGWSAQNGVLFGLEAAIAATFGTDLAVPFPKVAFLYHPIIQHLLPSALNIPVHIGRESAISVFGAGVYDGRFRKSTINPLNRHCGHRRWLGQRLPFV